MMIPININFGKEDYKKDGKCSAEEATKIIKEILTYLDKTSLYVGVSDSDFDLVVKFAPQAINDIIEHDVNVFYLIKAITTQNFASFEEQVKAYDIIQFPIDYILKHYLNYTFLTKEARWVKKGSSSNLENIFSDIIDLSMKDHHKYICSQIEKDYKHFKEILSVDDLKNIYKSNTNLIGKIREDCVIIAASTKEEAVKKAALHVDNTLKEWMFDLFDYNRVESKYFELCFKANEYFLFKRK